MSRGIIQQLKQKRSSTHFGAVSSVEKETAKRALMVAIGAYEQEQRAPYVFAVFGAWMEQLRFTLVSVPVGVAMMAFLALVGSVGFVGATNSVPGDALYSVKVATERAQIKIASQERRVLLRTEFAERRLQEVVKLNNEGASAERTAQALANYEAQVTVAKNELKTYQATEPQKAAVLAVQVDEKIDKLNEIALTQDNVQASVTKEASKAVVEVIVDAVETAEAQEKEVSSGSVDEFEGQVINRAIKDTYNKRLRAVMDRQTLDFGRVARLKEWYERNNQAVPAEVNRLGRDVEDVSEMIYESMTLIAQGGYRKAFELVEDSEIQLFAIEAALAESEMAVIEAQEALMNPPQEEPADNSESEESTNDIISPVEN